MRSKRRYFSFIIALVFFIFTTVLFSNRDVYATTYGSTVLYDSYKVSWRVNDDGKTITITSLDMNIREIVIPSEIDGYIVTSIGLNDNEVPEDLIIAGNSTLVSITLPDSLTSIGDYAFLYCDNLTTINIPEGVMSIGYDAFYGCNSLTSINIPEGVTSIGSNAFYGCSSLTTINIPEGVMSIGYDAFYGCFNLKSISIPDGVESIGYGAFGNTGIEELYYDNRLLRYHGDATQYTIREGTERIDPGAFAGDHNLQFINIPDSVTSIGKSAFSYCNSLKTINIPDGVDSIHDNMFYGCSSLTTINIPSRVDSIGDEAFYGCSSLTMLIIPRGVNWIGEEAFYGCSSLTSMILPENWAAEMYRGEPIGDCSGLTLIKGIKGSSAEEYANESSIPFVEVRRPEMTEHPENVYSQPGDVEFSVAAEGDGLTYQWYYRENSDSTWQVAEFPGSRTPSMTVEAILERDGYQYRCEVKGWTGDIVYSNPATLTVYEPIVITKQPLDVTAVDGSGNVKFSVVATGSDLTYQWYWRKNASASWVSYNSTASASNTEMTVGVIAARNGFQYRCSIKDANGTVAYSDVATLTVTPKPINISILAQPSNVAAKDGSGNVRFSVLAAGSGLTYQWYWRKNASAEWGISGSTGAKTANLAIDAISARNGFQYYCKITNVEGGTVNSDIATLTVTSSLEITKQPKSIVAENGADKATFSISAVGKGLTYQWYWRNSLSSGWLAYGNAGSKNTSLSIGSINDRNGFQYYCEVRDSSGDTIKSDIATLVVRMPAIYITKQPTDVSMTAGGGNATFSVSASGDSLTYQWYWRADKNSAWAKYGSEGSANSKISIGAISARNGYQYYCHIKDVLGNEVKTDVATLMVKSSVIAITKQPVSVETVKTGTTVTNVTFEVGATGTGLVYQWYWRKNASAAWEKYGSEGSEKTKLSIGAIVERNGFQYYCKIKDLLGNVVNSNIATLTVRTTGIVITKQPQDVTTPYGNTTFSVAAGGTGLTYQWYWRVNEAGGWQRYESGDSSSTRIFVKATGERNGSQYYCEIKDIDHKVVKSNVATLTVKPSVITITKQPTSVIVSNGSDKTTFSVGATGNSLVYQWYWRNSLNSEWLPYGTAGGKTSISVGSISDRNGFQYYCEITDSSGNRVCTDVATLIVRQSAFQITKQPKNVTAANGSGNVLFSVSAVGNGLTYQWYWRKNANSVWMAYNSSASAVNTEISVGAIAARHGFQYYCVIKDSIGNIVNSDIATLKIVESPTILKQPTNITAKNGGSTVKFNVEVAGVGVIYQWYWRKNSSSDWGVSGSTGARTATLSIDPITARNGFQYFCVVKDSSGNITTTDFVTLTVTQ